MPEPPIHCEVILEGVCRSSIGIEAPFPTEAKLIVKNLLVFLLCLTLLYSLISPLKDPNSNETPVPNSYHKRKAN